MKYNEFNIKEDAVFTVLNEKGEELSLSLRCGELIIFESTTSIKTVFTPMRKCNPMQLLVVLAKHLNCEVTNHPLNNYI